MSSNDDLGRLAEAAKAFGPWGDPAEAALTGDPQLIFAAAASPDRILALLGERDALRETCTAIRVDWIKAATERDALKAELARLIELTEEERAELAKLCKHGIGGRGRACPFGCPER